MISLKDHATWQSLSHAYGPAEKIPALLIKGAWQELWGALCHQGTIYNASLATAPHVLEIGKSGNRYNRVEALRLFSAILIEAEFAGLPDAAKNVINAYQSCLLIASSVLLSAMREVADEHNATFLLAAIAALYGHKKIGYDLFYSEERIVCPNCEATFPRYYDLDENYSFADDELHK